MLSPQMLAINAPAVVEQIAHSIRAQVLGTLRRRGVVVGLSGGVDSAVVAALCVHALGRDKVLALFMPERDSSEDALRLGRLVADTLGVDDISKFLYTRGQPDPDLVIRTSGEQRLSGFLLWQSAHSEFYFCEAYWPAFRKIDFLRALRDYAQRQRRYGA